MIVFADLLPYVVVSPNLRFELLEQYINATKSIDVLDLLGKNLYDIFFEKYNISKNIVLATKGSTTIIEVDDTTALTDLNYCYVDATWHKGRVKFNIIGLTQIELLLDTSNLPSISGGVLSWFCNYDFFEKLRPFVVISSWIRYSQLGKIQSTNAGLVQKNTDFSEFVGDKELGLYLGQWKRDLNFYRAEILKFIDVKCEKTSRKKQIYAITKKNEYAR